jgi:serine/threonine protein kinase
VTLHSSLPSHRSLLKLQTYFEDSDHVYLVTDLCQYGNLHRYMASHPEGLPEDQVRLVMRDIVAGLKGSISI